jgi:hypothetical protein
MNIEHTSTFRNAVELEMLIKLYYSGDPVSYEHSVAAREAAQRLARHGVAEWHNHDLVITEAGTFFVKHLLEIPYPKQKMVFFIPEAA